MAQRNTRIVPAFDFTEAQRLSLTQRFERSIERAGQLLEANGYQGLSHFPCIPSGASAAELEELESQVGMPLPQEYRQFLSHCRYLKLDDGLEVGGLDHEGVYPASSPWVSTEHRPGVEFLVFADYWRYADGDQLMFALSEPGQPVVAYLHSHGPLFEPYAPSFSLALWRLVHEAETDEH
jgi:hypothetical protein